LSPDWFAARAAAPAESAIVSRLDRDAGGTGRLLTRAEIDDPRYDSPVRDVLATTPAPPAPAVRCAVLAAAPWLIFAAIPFFLAPARIDPADPRGNAIEAALVRLDEKLATLEEEIALEQTGDADLRERLDSVRDAAQEAVRDGALESALEALDRMEQELAAVAERAERGIERATDAAQDAIDHSAAGTLDASFEQLASELDAAGLGDTLAAARAELAKGNETDAAPTNAEESGSAGDEPGAASSSPNAGASNPRAAALAAALSRQLSDKHSALQSAGLLPELDPALAAKLAALADRLGADGELGELTPAELAELEEVDLCDEESHGPG
jgi:hypothetical protein